MSFEANYEYRTGIGTDIHRFVEGKELKLGGVLVPYKAGLLAHSDGDAGIHAIMDAILGAVAIGDVGVLFPDTDPQFKDIDSKQLLAKVKGYIEDDRWEIVNVDLIIHAEQPRLENYKMQMKRCIASVLGIDFKVVNVKAKTNEGLGPIGRAEAISATANVLLRRRIKRTL